MHLLKMVKDNDGKIIYQNEPEILNKVDVDDKYVKRVQEGLKAVTTYGSGRKYVSIDSSGKTGTSESFIDSNHDGKIDTETISTNFVMYAPSTEPKVSISINSPNIGTPKSEYRYPINQNVIKNITSNISKYLK